MYKPSIFLYSKQKITKNQAIFVNYIYRILFFVFKFLKSLSRLYLFLYLNFIHSKFQSKVLLLGYFEFFESVFSFTLSFILKRREKLPKSANNASILDVAQALILDHFVSTGLVFWSTVYFFIKEVKTID